MNKIDKILPLIEKHGPEIVDYIHEHGEIITQDVENRSAKTESELNTLRLKLFYFMKGRDETLDLSDDGSKDFDKFLEVLKSDANFMESLKGENAEPATDEELIALITPLIPEPIKLSAEELTKLITPLIPKVENGHTPTKEEITKLITPLLPKYEVETSDSVITKINTGKTLIGKNKIDINWSEYLNTDEKIYKVEDIKGLPEAIRKLEHSDARIKSNYEQVAGGGASTLVGLTDVVSAGATIGQALIKTSATKYGFASITPDLSAYWKRDGSSTATGNWTLGTYNFAANTATFLAGRIFIGSDPLPDTSYAKIYDNGGGNLGFRAYDAAGYYSDVSSGGIATSGNITGADAILSNAVSSQYSVANYLLSPNDYNYGGYGSISIGDNTSLQHLYWQIFPNGSANFCILPSTSGISMSDSGGGFPMLNINNVISMEGDTGGASFNGTVSAGNGFTSGATSYLDFLYSLDIVSQHVGIFGIGVNQLQVGYDNTANYLSVNVSSVGVVSFIANGGAPRFTFSKGLTLPAGLSGAGFSPLKFATGGKLTTPETGVQEFDTNFYQTNNNSIRFTSGGTLATNTTAVGNIGIGDDDLMTYAMAANTLSVNGGSIRGRASGVIANNINAKRLRFKFGGTTVLDTGATGFPISQAIQWVMEYEIIRTGATTQKCNASLTTNNASLASYSGYATATETLSNAITLKLTGEGTTNNDVVQETMTVRFNPL